MASKLTKKEKGFVNDFVKTGNGTKSALNNYDTKSENVAGAIASQNLRKLKIQKAVMSIADSIPDELLTKKHLELLNTRISKKKIDVQGVSKGLDMAYKLKGAYSPEDDTDKMKSESILLLIKTNQAILAKANGRN